jgi:hypothetical protein
MSVLLLLAMLQSGPAEKALDRYANFMAQNKAFSVEFTASMPGAPEAKGSLTLEQGRRLRYHANWGPENYDLAVTPVGTL